MPYPEINSSIAFQHINHWAIGTVLLWSYIVQLISKGLNTLAKNVTNQYIRCWSIFLSIIILYPKYLCRDSGHLNNLNSEQKQMIHLLCSKPVDWMPPVLLVGPYGTGKTYTLAKAAMAVLVSQDSKLLICTHSNRWVLGHLCQLRNVYWRFLIGTVAHIVFLCYSLQVVLDEEYYVHWCFVIYTMVPTNIYTPFLFNFC